MPKPAMPIAMTEDENVVVEMFNEGLNGVFMLCLLQFLGAWMLIWLGVDIWSVHCNLYTDQVHHRTDCGRQCSLCSGLPEEQRASE
jgi:hypothetical protein